MNVQRYETETHKRADKLHERAQQSGKPSDYIAAAELYAKSGDYGAEATCREAAERLAK